MAGTRSELLQARAELTAACSDLAEFKGSVDKRLGDNTSHTMLGRLQSTSSKSVQRGSRLERLNQRTRFNKIVLRGVTDSAAHNRPADLTCYVNNKLDAAAPGRGSPFPALSQCIQAVSHTGRPGRGKRAVLVEFSTHTANHAAFKLSPLLRHSGLHLANGLTPKPVKEHRRAWRQTFLPFLTFALCTAAGSWGTETRVSIELGQAIRATAPSSSSRASPAPPRPPPRGPAPARQGVRTSWYGHPSSSSTAGGGPAPGHWAASYAVIASAAIAAAANAAISAAIAAAASAAAANAASAAAAAAMVDEWDTEVPAPSPGPGAGPSALAHSQ